MSDKRDMLDELIDIRQDWAALSNPLSTITKVMTGQAEPQTPYNPSDYKERPRVNSMFCLNVCAASTEKNDDIPLPTTTTCSACMAVCPVDAITIEGTTVRVSDDCRMCGLCTMVCPTETFLVQRLMAKSLYDSIARAASMFETCYVTCTRALGRKPYDNEIVLPCVGAVPRDVWIALLAEYSNISVFLPLGVCDRCKTTTGEEAYCNEIGAAEEFMDSSLGMEVDAKALSHELSRAFKRQEFMGDVARAGQSLLAAQNPVIAGVQAVTKKLQQHSNELYELQCTLENALGDSTTSHTRRILTQKRKLLLGVIQKNPALANRCSESMQVPVCNQTACTACLACVRVCPEHACNIDEHGRFSVEGAYCLNCSACAIICPEQCLEMKPGDVQELVVRDPEAERLKRQKALRQQHVREVKTKGKQVVNAVLNSISHMYDE